MSVHLYHPCKPDATKEEIEAFYRDILEQHFAHVHIHDVQKYNEAIIEVENERIEN